MNRQGTGANRDAELQAVVAPFDDEPDATLIDEMLRLKVSDRLRMLCRNVNALRRFRPV